MDESTRLSAVVSTAAPRLAKERDLHTVGDLLRYWPRRYRSRDADLSALHVGEYVVVVADVKQAVTRPMRNRRGRILTVTITDGSFDMEVTFFKPYGHEERLVPGARAVFAGEVSRYGQKWQLAHPDYQILAPESEGLDKDRGLIPIYRRVPKLQNWTIVDSLNLVFDQLGDVPDVIPADVRRRRRLPDRLEALRGIHQPRDWPHVQASRRRLRYEEAFVLQTVLAKRRREQALEKTVARRPREGGLLAAFDERLPFDLTQGQREVGDVLASEMARDTPMHRLLQGEVGSGKTVIALRAMLAVVDAGGQAALLAPTEVLAAQHHRSVTQMLGDLAEGGMLGGSEIGTRVALLTGSQPTSARRQALLDVASGDAGVVIGTHALIQQDVSFFDLALVVVDEQHRFGVEQRDALREKGKQPPHVLVMTATPIPRTVAMTVFGDMETSTLRELPAGRSPIATHLVQGGNSRWVERTWERVGEEARQGRQAYVVCPRIGGPVDIGPSGAAPQEEEIVDTPPEPEDVLDRTEDLRDRSEDTQDRAEPREWASVYAVEAALRRLPALAGLDIGVLHGRLSPEEKDLVMGRFGGGEIDVLVSTTVIEVGVDVPNATVMVVMDADRFGVSQLHQLRGRVGRGRHPGLCLLMTDTEAQTALERLAAVAGTTDGFELARLDLEQRREGDVLGSRQSGGRNQLEFLSILRDEELVEQAREDAVAVVEADPLLARHPELAAAVADRIDEEQAAFLERG
ncbi:ATP-dependent DNA helicase RecG [Pedococcus sp. 5OH_020]|uniref:ATP-dependent DNA helicase RecG n=1 Tax=Pedococcus sp. 5OH_020 TaxID=2989814 RepID=UPI002FDBD404